MQSLSWDVYIILYILLYFPFDSLQVEPLSSSLDLVGIHIKPFFRDITNFFSKGDYHANNVLFSLNLIGLIIIIIAVLLEPEYSGLFYLVEFSLFDHSLVQKVMV